MEKNKNGDTWFSLDSDEIIYCNYTFDCKRWTIRYSFRLAHIIKVHRVYMEDNINNFEENIYLI